MDEEQTMEQVQVTTFESDKQVTIETQPGMSTLPTFVSQQHTDSSTHSVISYLQRPQLLYQGEWKTSDVRHSRIGDELMVPESLFTTMTKQKLEGFTSFRATAVIRVQVQSQPFMAGRLILVAAPMPELLGTRTGWLLNHVSRSQPLNHVEMDISKETEVQLRIPFISPYNSYDLISSLWSWARVKCMVYSPLNMANASPVNVIFWGHFEDIDLGAPTSLPFAHYSDLQKLEDMPATVSEAAKRIVDDARMAQFRRSKYARQQAGPVKEKTNTQVRQTRQNENIVDKIGAGAQAGWSKLGTTLPFLQPVTDVLGGLSSAAQSFLSPLSQLFGWSKPAVASTGSTVLGRPTEGFANINGEDHSLVLALVKENNIDTVQNLAGTSCDEMSFDYIKKIPIFIKVSEYMTTTGYGALLYHTYVSPMYLIPNGDLTVMPPLDATKVENAGITIYQPTTLNYAISAFEYWTGSLVYTFKFVKTDYHSGRVEIAFHPFGFYDSTRTDFAYRVVVDLREKTEASVSVPYIAPCPWKRIETDQDPHNSNDMWKTDFANTSTGYLTMRALTPLMCSSTVVSNKIEILVEVRAGDDFHVASPVKSAYIPVTLDEGEPTQDDLIHNEYLHKIVREQGGCFSFHKSKKKVKTEKEEEESEDLSVDLDIHFPKIAQQQSGRMHSAAGQIETRSEAIEGVQIPSITGNDQDCNRPDMQMVCAGERFDNFRTLTRRFAFMHTFKNTPSEPGTYLNPSIFVRPPRVQYQQLYNGAEAEGKYPEGAIRFRLEYYASPLTFVGSMFAFYRGGIRLKFFPDRDMALVGVRVDGRIAAEINAQKWAPSYMSPLGLEQPSLKRILEYQVPYYGNTVMSCAWPRRPGLYEERPSGRVYISQFHFEDQEINYFTAVAAADDLDFKVFLGAPAVYPRQALGNTFDAQRGETVYKVPVCDNETLNVDPTSRINYGDIGDSIYPTRRPWIWVLPSDLR